MYGTYGSFKEGALKHRKALYGKAEKYVDFFMKHHDGGVVIVPPKGRVWEIISTFWFELGASEEFLIIHEDQILWGLLDVFHCSIDFRQKYDTKINWYIICDYHKHALADIVNEHYETLVTFCQKEYKDCDCWEYYTVPEEWRRRFYGNLRIEKKLGMLRD